ncbi:MAG TPA: alpha/beta fold hydrolase, partial [Candidatus Paceibacterota bacterium]|nr:alpha/beta fold hydrolase [Candidatus Paceibacterota bacterium]
MAKRIFIIHGWTGNPNEHWMPWLDTKLKENGFEVFQPEMPETDHPKMDAWISTLKKEIGAADSNTYLVGHSIGCLAILRYLEKYGEKIGGAVLVAPWTSLYPESFSVPED